MEIWKLGSYLCEPPKGGDVLDFLHQECQATSRPRVQTTFWDLDNFGEALGILPFGPCGKPNIYILVLACPKSGVGAQFDAPFSQAES